jgi:hypothetical protein
MEFSDVATYFDDDEIFDAYTGELLFMGHTSQHDDHTSSGATARRRTLSAAVCTAAPARRVVRWYDTYWLVGNNNTDAFQGVEVRRSYGLKKSSGIMTVVTPGGAALGTAGVDFHAHKEYYRDMTDALTSSDMDVMWNIFCPRGEPVFKGSFLRQGATLFRVRNVYESVDEYIIAEADQFDADALTSATFTENGPLNLVTETATIISTAVQVVQTDVPKYYTFRTEAEATAKPGDHTVFVAKSAITPKVGANFTMLGVKWRVITVASEGDSWALRARIA